MGKICGGGGDFIASEQENIYIAQGFGESRKHGWRRVKFGDMAFQQC